MVGLGGLGHLALQFAAAVGADVYAISHTASKEKEARGFGARHFQSIDDVPDKTLDVILNTTPGYAYALLPHSTGHIPTEWDCHMHIPFGVGLYKVLCRIVKVLGMHPKAWKCTWPPALGLPQLLDAALDFIVQSALSAT